MPFEIPLTREALQITMVQKVAESALKGSKKFFATLQKQMIALNQLRNNWKGE